MVASILARSASALVATAFWFSGSAQGTEAVKLLAAGSLNPAMSEIGRAFPAKSGVSVKSHFGPSGLLRERIAGGEEADIFASANLAHPQAIAQERGLQIRPFARNTLCALAQPKLEVSSQTLLVRLLDRDVRVGTSTPGADPSGDYAWELFGKAEKLQPGAGERLKKKALQLTGGPSSRKPPIERSVYGWVMEEGRAEIFLTYCTNAVLAAAEVPGLRIVDIPEALSVGADALVTLERSPQAHALADFILSAAGQGILASYGFAPPRIAPGPGQE